MVKKIFASLIISLSFFFPSFAQEEIHNFLEEENTGIIIEENGNIYEIPGDIYFNLGKTPGELQKSAEANKAASAANNKAANNVGKKKPDIKKNTGQGIQKLQGFRIQVFSDGGNPATLQARARARGNAIIAKLPKYRGQVYSFSQAPNWYTRIGNFQTSQEASKALAELKKAFPNFAAEMRVVKSPITIINK